jgi:hypothetical protein
MTCAVERVDLLLLADGLVVLAFVGICYCSTKSVGLCDRLGVVGWSFSASWASTITEVGAVFGIVVASRVSDTRAPSVPTLMGLNLLFGAAVLMAPLLFNALSRVDPDPQPRGQGPQYSGYVLGFLAACFLTLWAVVGQLAALSTIAYRIGGGAVSPWVWVAVAASSVVLVGIYAWKTIRAVLTYHTERAAVADSKPKAWALL